MLNENFVWLAISLGVIGNIYYVLGTIKGKIKPNRVSFFLWALIPMIAFFAELKERVGIQSLITLMVSLGPLAIFIASFVNKKSYWKITRFDLACGALSVLGVFLWLITKNSNNAIIFSVSADTLASFPTFIKAYKFPETEQPFPWLSSTLAGLITLLTISDWTFAYTAYPLAIFAINGIVYIFVKFKINKYNLL